MEAIEFSRQRKRMCDYYGDDTCVCDDSRGACPALDIDCSFTTEHPERLLAIVEQWAKEHPQNPEQERQNPEQERQKPEQEQQKPEREQQKPEQDDLEGAISREIASHKTRIENLDHDVFVIRNNLAVLGDQIYALREKVDHTPTEEPSQTPEPKRTNKDVLLAAFPNARMDDNGMPDVCPCALNKNYNNCNDFASCSRCRCTHWSAEAEE